MRERCSKQMAVRVSPVLLEQIERAAVEERRTVADVVRVLLADSLAARWADQQWPAHIGGQAA